MAVCPPPMRAGRRSSATQHAKPGVGGGGCDCRRTCIIGGVKKLSKGTKDDRLEQAIIAACEATGLEWEIDDLARVGDGLFVVKLGIYPWGKTILDGSHADIMNDIGDILAETQGTLCGLKCPACSGAVPGEALMIGWRCHCGARFVVSMERYLNVPPPAEYKDLWLAVQALPGAPTALPDTVFTGAVLEDIVDGAWGFEPLNNLVYVFSQTARWKPFAEWPSTVRFWAALAELRFVSVPMRSRGRAEEWQILWKGRVGDVLVTVGKDGDQHWVGLKDPILELADRPVPDRYSDEYRELSEAFSEFLLNEPCVLNDCKVCDFIGYSDSASCEGAYIGETLDGETLPAAASAAAVRLSAAVSACRFAAERFLRLAATADEALNTSP